MMTCMAALRRPPAGGVVDRHRLAGAKAARDRRGRRHPPGAADDFAGAAGADRHLLAPPATPGRSGISLSTNRTFRVGPAVPAGGFAAVLLLARLRRRAGFRAARRAGGRALHAGPPCPGKPGCARSRGHGAAPRCRPRHPGRVVDAVPLGTAQRADRRGVAGQSDARGGRSGVAPGARTDPRRQGRVFPDGAGEPLSPSRNKTSASLSPTPANDSLYYSLYNAQVSVSYVPDVFGGTRRQVEALPATEKRSAFSSKRRT